MEGWSPQVPEGILLEPMSPEYSQFEKTGMSEVGYCGFVLVAGGLGERLGYNGIKVELPTETITGTCYLGLYCTQILAMQRRFAVVGHSIPLAIMVSDDTEAKTRLLLEKENYFGLQKQQVCYLLSAYHHNLFNMLVWCIF